MTSLNKLTNTLNYQIKPTFVCVILMVICSFMSIDLLALNEYVYSGQVWRILSAHFSHFSTTHLVANIIMLIIIHQLFLKTARIKALWLTIFIAIAIVSVGIISFDLNNSRYAGFSSINYALLSYALFRIVLLTKQQIVGSLGLMAIITINIIQHSNAELFDVYAGFTPSAFGHSLGIVSGLLIALLEKYRCV